MFLGKRRRPQMKRTASVSGITVDLSHVEGQQPSDDQNPSNREIPPAIADDDLMNTHNSLAANLVSPSGRRRNLSGFNDGGTGDNSAVPYLRTCSFCHRRLSPARDIYMYMGDTAFCSAECREQKMKQDEEHEKDDTTGDGDGGRRC